MAIVAGIVLFLAVGSPQGGTSTPPSSAWWSAGICSALIIGVLFSLARRRHGATTALMFGAAAGVAFALQASVTKVFVTLIGQGLSSPMLSSWTVYVLIGSALVGFVLQQSALKTGILAPAMAASNSVTLFVSVVLGVTLFGETLSNGSDRLVPAVIGLAVALCGIVLLAGAKPPDATAAPPSGGSRRSASGPRRAVH